MKRLISVAAVAALLITAAGGQRDLGVAPTTSGGALSDAQAAYDVLAYELDLEIDPERRWIGGVMTMEAELLAPVDRIVLDLDSRLDVAGVDSAGEALEFEHADGRLAIDLGAMGRPGRQVRLSVRYSGTPKVAPRPPWVGGFVWDRTADGSPWVGVACQMDGADLWWPVKDHVSDEPERAELSFRVPAGLVAVSNGRLREVEEHPDGDRTFHWQVSNPINTYNVTVNVAPYVELRHPFVSRSGEPVDFSFWALPESRSQAEALLDHYADQVHFLEDLLGPYPFRHEKYGVVQTRYLGMEHQTAIAYGSTFERNEYGFDWLHFHELAHEWWGNLVTATDWRDFWLHEGFASYMEALYAAHLNTPQTLHEYMAGLRRSIRNERPVAPLEPQTTREKYFVPPDFTRSDGDVNSKGAWVLHTLRWVVGDDAFFRALRRFAAPQPGSGRGCGCRFATTDDFRRIVEAESGRSLEWFFEVYLRQPHLPELVEASVDGSVELRWKVPGNLEFPMPVEVQVGTERRRVEVPAAGVAVPTGGQPLVVDPDGWILRVE